MVTWSEGGGGGVEGWGVKEGSLLTSSWHLLGIFLASSKRAVPTKSTAPAHRPAARAAEQRGRPVPARQFPVTTRSALVLAPRTTRRTSQPNPGYPKPPLPCSPNPSLSSHPKPAYLAALGRLKTKHLPGQRPKTVPVVAQQLRHLAAQQAQHGSVRGPVQCAGTKSRAG